MAVEIPVVVDIEKSFEEQIAKVPAVCKRLQQTMSKNALEVKINLDTKGATAKVSDFVNQSITDMTKLRRAISQIRAEMANLALSGGDNTEQWGALNEALKGLTEIKKVAESVVNEGLKAAEAERRTVEEEKERLDYLNLIQNTLVGVENKFDSIKQTISSTKFDDADFNGFAVKLRQASDELKFANDMIAELGMKSGSIEQMALSLGQLADRWRALGSEQMFDKNGNLTRQAKQIQTEYTKIAQKLEKQRGLLDEQLEAQRKAEAEARRRAEEEDRVLQKMREEEEAERKRQELLQQSSQSLSELNAQISAWQNELSHAKFGTSEFARAAQTAAFLEQKLAAVNAQIRFLGAASGSIDQLQVRLSEINRQYNALGDNERAGAAGQKLLQEYRQISTELHEQGKSLQQIIQEEESAALAAKKRADEMARAQAKRKEENALLRRTARNLSTLQAQAAVLQERLSQATFGTKQFDRLKSQLDAVNAKMKEVTVSTERMNATILPSLGTHLSGIVKSLTGMAAFQFMFRFTDNIRKVTSEFEMQRVALGGIIQDTDKAADLFKKLKAAAIQSPFEIKDLVTYAKQLSAYRIETDKLYDVTMRLADVSAGLGVDMNRLILAYGQIRAASVLRGQELRQLTEAGLPIIELLAEKFTELNQRAYTTAEVFDLISKRAVPFSMIEEIFNDMTDAGGIFYNMQEKQSETLKGQWMKLKDAASIMYDEIGNTTVVHEGMEDILALIMKSLQHWRTMGQVIAGVTTTILAYRIALRQTRIELNAQTLAQAKNAVAKEKNTISTSRLIVALRGEAAAEALQTKLTNALTAAKIRERMATNALTRAVYRLEVAMLSNPYAMVAAAIAAIIAGLVIWRKSAKKTALSLDDFNASIERYSKSLEQNDKIKDLCNAYDRLSEKQDKSKTETEQLARVTKDLANAYPSAISGIDEQTNSLQLNTAAIRENIEAEEDAERKALEKQVAEARKTLNELTARRTIIDDSLTNDGQLVRNAFSGDVGNFSRKKLSDGERSKLQNELLKLKPEIDKWSQALADAELQLNEFYERVWIGPPAPDFLGDAWRMQINSYSTMLTGATVATKAFTKDQIEGFSSEKDALEEVAKEYKKQTENVEFYSKVSKKATGELAQQNANLLADSKALQAMYALILTDFNAWELVDDKKGGSGSKFISELRNRISDLTNAYKKYRELRKYEGKDAALSDIALSFPQLKGFEPTMENTLSRLSSMLTKYAGNADATRLILLAMSNINFDAIKTRLADKISQLSDDLKRSETAEKMFKSIFDATGDSDFAANLTFEVYGNKGQEDFRKRLQRELAAAMQDVENPTEELQKAVQQLDFNTILKYLDKFPDAWQTELKKMAESNQKFNADMVQQWAKDLEKAKTFAEQRVTLAQTTAKRIAEVEQSNLSQEEKDRLIGGYNAKEAKEAAKLMYDAFKDTPLYVQMFENLDAVSTKTLTMMRDKLQSLQSEWKNLDPTELKEMQKRMEDIEEALASRNPFSALADGLKGMRKAREESGKTRSEADQAAYDAQQQADKAANDLNAAAQIYNEAYSNWQLLQTKFDNGELDENGNPITQEAINSAAQEADDAKEKLDTAQKLADETQHTADEANKVSNAFKDAAKWIQKGADGLSEWVDYLNDIASSTKGLLSEILPDDEASNVNAQIDNGMHSLQGAVDLGMGLATIVANPANIQGWIQIITGLEDTLAGIFGFINESKSYKAEKEITKQEKKIQSLTHAYERLQTAMEDALGSDYAVNLQQQIELLRAEQKAYQRQADAERSQGKKADKAAIEEYEESIRDITEQIADMQSQLSEFYTGTDVTSAAKDFATAWIDAYTSFSSTSGAIKDKFNEMIQNMVVNSVMAQAVQSILQPLFDEIDARAKSHNGLTVQDIADIADLTVVLTSQIDDSLTALATRLRAAGFNLRSTGSTMSGISKELSGATEESIQGLAAGVNTQNYYMSAINANVAAIYALMSGGQVVADAAASGASVTTAGSATVFGDETFRGQMSSLVADLSEIRYLLKSVITPRAANVNTHCIAAKV